MRPRDRWLGVAAVLPVAMGIPGIVAGPSLYADDWWFLARAAFVDDQDVGGVRQSSRPIANFLYRFEFGVIGAHPVALRVVVLVLVAAASAALYLVLRRHLELSTARAAVALWILMPTHSALEHWASAAQASLALALVLGGVLLLDLDGAAPRWRTLIGGASVLAGVLSYELVVLLPPAVAGWLVLRRRWTAAGCLLGGFALVLLWRSTERQVYDTLGGPFDLSRAIVANLAFGLDPTEPAAPAIAVLVVAAAALVLFIRSRAGNILDGERRAPVLSGVVLLALGLLPVLVTYPSFVGTDDRFNAVASIGAAMVVVGVVRALAANRALLLATSSIVLVVVGVARLEVEQNWHTSGREGLALVERLDATVPPVGRFAMEPGVRIGGVASVYDAWHATAALQLRRDGVAPLGCVRAIPGTGPGCPLSGDDGGRANHP